MGEPWPRSFYVLAAVFGLFVLFLYGPIATILVLSFQGPEGGLVFPMRGVSLHWFADQFRPLELQAMQTNATTPVIYALGTLTTGLSFAVIVICLASVLLIQRRRARHGSDAGKGV